MVNNLCLYFLFFCRFFFLKNWIAYEHFSSLLKAKESSEIMFADSEVPTAESNYALCKVRTHILTV